MKQDVPAAQNWAGARVLVLSPIPTHPHDDGNRKHIFEVCRRLATEGARITFVHYAAQEDRRGHVSWDAERAMAAAWSKYYTVAPTRPFYANSTRRHYLIDEWWDPGIASFLRWLFSVRSFDIFIVNYSWLSKAFEFAPASVFKILDTHEKLLADGEALEPAGLDREFFHTTEAEEKIALDRADLAWAITDEDRAAFERVTATPVWTMPHVDPFNPVSRPEPDPAGYLRVGIVGVRDDVDRINITRFLKLAEPVFRETFAPVKLIVAGSVCSMLGDLSYPFVELRGTVKSVADFYRSVDCIAIPVEISGGQKIAAAEAISLGVPVVSTARAFEGLPICGNLHALANLSELAHALADLSFAPRTELDVSLTASRSAHAQAVAQIDRVFQDTADLVRRQQRLIVLAVDSRAFVPDSVFNLALTSAHENLRHLAAVVVLVVTGNAEDVAANPSIVDRFGRVVVAEEVADTPRLRDTLGTLGVDICATGVFLRLNRPRMVIADALNSAMFLEHCPDCVLVARTELIAFSERSADFRLPVQAYRRVFAAAPAHSREMAGRLSAAGVELLLEACFPRPARDTFPARSRNGEKKIALLGSPRAPAMASAIRMAQSWDLKPFVVFGMNENAPSRWGNISCIRADAYVAGILKGTDTPPQFAADLSAGAPGLPLCREALERMHVPTLSASCASCGFDMLPLAASTQGGLWRALRSFATDPYRVQERNFAGFWRDLDEDPGWAWLRRYSAGLLENDGAEFAY